MVKNWPVFTIGDILDFKNGLNKGKEFFGCGTPIVNYTDVYHNSGIKEKDIKGKVTLTTEEIRRFEVRKNDVFFTRTSETPAEVGLSAVLLEDIPNCVFSGFILRGRPKNDWLNGEYCKYCFSTKHIREEIVRNCTYTTRALTNGKILSTITIPVPPKHEQEGIAEALSSFEQYIADFTELIEKKRGIRDGALEDLMSGRTRLEGQNISWVDIELGELATYRKGNYTGAKDHYISTENINQGFSGIKRYSSRDVVEGCSFYEADTLIANIRPYLRKVWYAEFSGICSLDVLALQPKPVVDSKYLYYLVANDRFINYVMNGGIKGIKMPRGDKKFILKYSVRIPSEKNIQAEIAQMITSMDNEIASLEAERDKMIQIREGAMDDLLTGRVRLIG